MIFPNFRLRPEHHFIEHYPELIKAFGPLSDVWTMFFKRKHKFFSEAIHNAHNFTNVALTLAVKHHKMMAYYLDSSSFFKPSVEIDMVTSPSISSRECPISKFYAREFLSLQQFFSRHVFIEGIRYCADIILSFGSCPGFPKFKQIKQIVAINT